jgi:hypothetical protein
MESVMSAPSSRGSPAVWGVAVQRQWRRWPGGGASRRWLRPSLKIDLGLGQWGVMAAREPRTVSRDPHLLLLRSATGAHQPLMG